MEPESIAYFVLDAAQRVKAAQRFLGHKCDPGTAKCVPGSRAALRCDGSRQLHCALNLRSVGEQTEKSAGG